MKTFIKGTYRKNIFKSEKGYIIGLFKITETNEEKLQENKTITFTGYFHELNHEDNYILYGKLINHPRYGIQFEVEEYERIKPTEKEAVIEFLSSDLFKGIGEKQAKKIVESLGENALDKILKDKTSLNIVPNLSQKKIDSIYNTLQKYDESHQIIVNLTNMGFNMKDALIIYNKYKTMTKDIIQNNIYKITELPEIPFTKIDAIALKNGIKNTDRKRIKSLIIYIMTNLIYQNGDTYIKRETITNNVNRYINEEINYENYDNYFYELENEKKIKIDKENYYLKTIWDAENNIINTIYMLSNKKNNHYKNIENEIEKLSEETNITYNKEQITAIKKSLENNIIIITGGPGTGKTTIIKAITTLYQKINNLNEQALIKKIALLAPTGRAAKRMSTSTNLPACTIHRFLKWNKETNEFLINENNKTKENLIIIDEVSMIDINLFDSLLKGLSSNIKLILVGDYNQLPSVGPGQLLKDLINSDVIDVVYLEKLYRQNENSYIPTLSREIQEGNLSETYLETTDDYTFLKCKNTSIKKNLKILCKTIINKGYNYKNFQLLAPMYKGENGIDLLNKELQEVFNPPSKEKREIQYGMTTYREQDKILQLINMPDNNVYNGDIGIIKYIKYENTSKSKKNEIYVDFDGNIVKYTPQNFKNIKHGYIISIHKSQGSEFDLVIMPMDVTYNRMLYKKLIYTGITRAKKKLILIGQPEAFLKSIYNNNEYKRNSKLLEKLMYRFNK